MQRCDDEAGYEEDEPDDQADATTLPCDTPADALQSPDVLAGIMLSLGLGQAHRVARVCIAWQHASLALREEQRVLRPSHSLGWGNETLSQFRSPSGIIPLPNGDLCIADTNNHRLQVLSRSGEVRAVFGQGPGGAAGEFQQPTGLACDGVMLYVADSGNCRLHKLALPSGEVLSTVGVFGDMPGQLHAPVGLALHEGRLFCADSRNHRISVFSTSPALRYLTSFCSHGAGAAELGSTSSGIYIATYEAELFIADRSNYRLQVLGLDGTFRRSIGRRGTAPGSFRRLRGVAASAGRIFTAECERVQVLALDGKPLQVLPLPGSTALVGISADDANVCVVDQTHQKVRVLAFCQDEGRAAFGPPRVGEPHLRPFLLPTSLCDSEAASIVALARRLIPPGCSAARAAATVRAWVRTHIRYVLHDKSDTASATLAKREGMCTNKANLQCALLRAAGLPAGYVLLHITKAAFDSPHILDEVYELISPITLHVFCAVYIPYQQSARPAADHAAEEWFEEGCFRHYDATERAGASHLTEHVPHSDETRFQSRFQRGPFSPVQANLDHLLTPGSKIPDHLLEQQNALYREHPI